MITEEYIEFNQIREHSPQWQILANGREIATVTEAWFFKGEKYTIVFVDGTSKEVHDRDTVVTMLVDFANMPANSA